MRDKPEQLADLDEPRRQLILTMQGLNFGRIENLPIRNGSPDFGAGHSVVYEFKIGGEIGPRMESGRENFALCQKQIDLLEILDSRQKGVIRSLTVKHGLPFMFEFEK